MPSVYPKKSTLRTFIYLTFTGGKEIVNNIIHYEPYLYFAYTNSNFFRSYDVRIIDPNTSIENDQAPPTLVFPFNRESNPAFMLTSGVMLNRNYNLNQDQLDIHFAQNEPETLSAAAAAPKSRQRSKFLKKENKKN